MKYTLNRSQLTPKLRPLLVLNLILFSLTLAACSDVVPTVEAPQPSYDLSLSVDINASSVRENIEARYGGDVVVWRPEAGFAILGLHYSLSTQSLDGATVELNQDQVVAPEAQVRASRVWGGGRLAWSGGRLAWSGGNNDFNIASEPTLSQRNVAAWRQIDLEGGLERAPRAGMGIKVAVIDSGLDLSHPAFTHRLAPAYEWRDFIDGDTYPQEERSEDGDDNYGHGTGVAGVVLQVAPQATILPLRVLNTKGVGDITDVAAAIDHAVFWGADVINLSLGTDEDSEVLNQMIAYAAERKVFVVASSGNTGDDRITYPARNAKSYGQAGTYLLSVGSVNAYSGYRSPFSTYGEALEFVAPGEYIYTAFPDQQVGYWSGTSFSAPMITGTLALMLAEDDAKGKVAERLETSLEKNTLEHSLLNIGSSVDWATH